MSSILPHVGLPVVARTAGRFSARGAKGAPAPMSIRFPSYALAEEDEPLHRQAELFYLQKQIQAQTPMVIVLEGGERVEGCIEWYDRHTLKVRGRVRMLVFKTAIKYMFKQGENGA
jgi:sRNA-binding regulator protein Hfq